jgi:hypothetical protein
VPRPRWQWGDERAHAECGAESESLVVIARGVLGVGGIAV